MKKTMLAAALGMTLVFGAQAQVENAAPVALEKQVESRLVSAFGPRLKVREVATLANGQILEVVLTDGSVMHMTPDMNGFIYRDELYELTADGPQNVTQNRNNPKRAESMAAVKDSDTVIFAAQGEQKGMINVFTDIDCGYCQKLHQEVPRLNELGITVRYLAYPRAGIKDPRSGDLTDSYRKINYVWCEGDRKAAMSTMKNTQREMNQLGQRLRNGGAVMLQDQYRALAAQMDDMMNKGKDCDAPIAQQFELGHEMGVTGTPAIITEDGRLFPGYMPADELARRLGAI
ncbi:DsbC family protein [Thalassolituus marinus]|uniref:Thiol:disulfide interchange protein n=1 Tax=Thalassolituus marinus TaxID=671053 RepID=A0ABS7ZNT3_9GAMM|nr:DsbC family protein [Thalassolituus marinus]MCA6063374.1 DsbC family protein [Thalassolituus marinus]